ncbi:efflux RND transporter periplasmic adaptor subunit [Panacibacter ginsenosidivorans]|uniref:Efflux RND transporter periplasmic adaptor subunit n=1 Tax=Panacibacter ginsenosidivorans TaxID=1813871 RepID=A0A5B8VFD6_9BACT|nr:efflux RND transporter periplasmic adaptor subunit [Panacibacter ginsenosidivorans]QEC69246.1 efflux RND transporter periplasmic adaptor subunit [Panacibacter ginsenosidivorans]
MSMNYLDKHFESGKSVAGYRLLCHSLQRLLFYSLFIIVVPIIATSCKEKKQTDATVNKDVYYTCSMHPQIHEEHPGSCPICGMKLIAVPKSSMNATAQVHLSSVQIKLGNIQADTIRNGSIGDKMILTGTLNFNQDNLSSVSARVEGRIERLYFKNIGDYVRKGDRLYDLYSEQLNNAKQEYVTALQQESAIGNSLINYHALVESAKNKLLLWGMTNGQINQLADGQQASTLTSFYSTEDGYITTLNVKEGDYVMDGGTVVDLANLSTLWAEAQVYTTQMLSFKKSENVTVQIPDLNNQTIDGKIDFVNPEINPDTRISLVRVSIPNPNNQLHPGMPVYIIANSSAHNSIALPVDAVLTDSKGSIVWVETQPDVYEARMVKTGINDGNAVEIISGLHTGDVVVTSGAYLINSEYIFQHGANPMEGMDMTGMKM